MKVKPEAATAVTELLMMGGKTAETCWAVNKRQDNKLENCCILLVIYLNNQFMLHGAEVVIYSEINTKHINTVWAEYKFLSFKSVGVGNQ
jgi:hypothetical protein